MPEPERRELDQACGCAKPWREVSAACGKVALPSPSLQHVDVRARQSPHQHSLCLLKRKPLSETPSSKPEPHQAALIGGTARVMHSLASSSLSKSRAKKTPKDSEVENVGHQREPEPFSRVHKGNCCNPMCRTSMYAQAESWFPEPILFPPVIDQHFMSLWSQGKRKADGSCCLPITG